MAYAFNSKNKQKIGDLVSAEDPQNNTLIDFADDKISIQVSGSETLVAQPSNITISGTLNITQGINTKTLSAGVRVKNFGPVSTTDTTTDSDFFLLYGTATNNGTVTLHQPNANGRILIFRKTSDSQTLFITCSSGLSLFNINNSNVNSLTMSAGTNTNRHFIYNNNIWYELFIL